MTDKNKLYPAILAVQQGAPFIDKSSDNPFFKSKYADLPDVWRAIKALMGENNLLVSHTIEANDNDYIVTRIIHAETGEFIESKSRIMLAKSTAQEYGSYITYMRRYAISAMLGLVTDEDDDGNKASNKPSGNITTEQAADLDNRINKLPDSKEYKPRFLEYMKVNKLTDIPANLYAKANNALTQKEAANVSA